MANLTVKSVNKIYPSGALALYNVGFELSDKEFVAVIGGEKSGKSTLLRVIAGLEDVSDGSVVIGGKDVTDVDPKDRDVAMIFQGNTLYPALSVFDNMAFGLKLRKASQNLIEQRVKCAADILGLSDVLYRKPKTLTSDQKQKVAFGRAIVREPKLYLLDDPIAGLDGDLKAQMRNIIVNLQARMEGTFIYATKNVNEALTMATRIIVLREGMVQQIDSPANLYDYPANAYVAFLVGSPTINFINNAWLTREGDAVVANFKGGSFPLSEDTVKRFSSLDEYVGTEKKVILGIRPEDLRADKENALFTAKVTAAEQIGGKTYVDCETQEKLSFVLAAEGAEKGAEIPVAADLSRLYVFDAETRLTLLARDGGYTETGYADADKQPLPFGEEEAVKNKLKKLLKEKKKK